MLQSRLLTRVRTLTAVLSLMGLTTNVAWATPGPPEKRSGQTPEISRSAAPMTAEEKLEEARRQQQRAPEVIQHTLTNGAGDGTAVIPVDGYGSFGSATLGGSVTYDPFSGAAASTVFDSGVYLNTIDQYLTTGSIGGSGGLAAPMIISTLPQQLVSSFATADGLGVILTQDLSNATVDGCILTQTYNITNTTGVSKTFRLVRHIDGDLAFDGSIQDGGKATTDGKKLSEFDAASNVNTTKVVFSITANTDTPQDTQTAFSIKSFRYSDEIVSNNGITPNDVDVVQGDTDGDRVTDSDYDVTLSIQNDIVLTPGQSVNYVTTTEFTEGAPLTADAELSMTSFPAVVAPGDLLNYEITVANFTGPETARGATVTDILPPGVVFFSVVGVGAATAMTPPVGSPGTVTVNLGNLTVGEIAQFTLTVEVTGNIGDTITNTADLALAGSFDPNLTNNSATISTPIVAPAPDLVLTKTGPPSAPQDTIIMYDLHLVNNGPGTAANVIVTDPLPNGTTYLGFSATQGNANGLPLGGTGTITLNVGSLRAGFSVDMTLTVFLTASGGAVVTNVANVTTTSPDPNLTNNIAVASTQVTTGVGRADLAISITDAPDPVNLGENVTYSITVANAGPDVANDVLMFNANPPGTRIVSLATTKGAFDTPSGSTGPIRCAIGSMNPNTSVSITAVLAVVDPQATLIQSVAEVGSTARDLNPANNVSSTTTSVNGVGGGGGGTTDVSISLSGSPSPVASGSDITYTATVRNLSAVNSPGTIATVILPANTAFVTAFATDGMLQTPDAGGTGSVTCTIPILQANTTVTVTIITTVNAEIGSTLTATGSVGTPLVDSNNGNNAATSSVQVAELSGPKIFTVFSQGGPFRIYIAGTNFSSAAQVFIGGSTTPWPNVRFVNEGQLVLRKGGRLRQQFRRGEATVIRVVNPDGSSTTGSFTR